MEPRHPFFFGELEPEEPLDADDYYDAILMGRLSLAPDEDLREGPIPGEPQQE